LAAAEKVRRWNQGTWIHKGGLDDAAEVIPAGGGGGFMLFQQAQAGTNDLGLIVEPPTGDKPLNQLLEMRRNDFAHAGHTFQQFQPVVNRF
jgi:hypothetical protein